MPTEYFCSSFVSIVAFFQTSAPIGFLQGGNTFLETKSYAKIKGISAHAKCTIRLCQLL